MCCNTAHTPRQQMAAGSPKSCLVFPSLKCRHVPWPCARLSRHEQGLRLACATSRPPVSLPKDQTPAGCVQTPDEEQETRFCSIVASLTLVFPLSQGTSHRSRSRCHGFYQHRSSTMTAPQEFTAPVVTPCPLSQHGLAMAQGPPSLIRAWVGTDYQDKDRSRTGYHGGHDSRSRLVHRQSLHI